MAKALNEKGKSVALLPEYENISNADAIVHFKKKLVIADFKFITSKKIGTLKKELKEGFEQAGTIVLKLENGNTDLLVQSIEELKRKELKIGNLILINKYNKITDLQEKDIRNNKYKNIIRGFL